MLAAGGSENSALVSLVRQLEERAMETARELAQVRQLVAARESSPHHGTSKRGHRPSPRSGTQESTSRANVRAERVATQRIERELKEAVARLMDQDRQIASMHQREEILQREVETATPRVSQLQTELHWERLHRNPQHTPMTPMSPSQRSPARRERPPKAQRGAGPLESPTRRSQPSAEPFMPPAQPSYSVSQLKGSDHPEIMAIGYRVLRERFPEMVAQRRPDLMDQIWMELGDERSGLQIICRAVTRRLWAVVQNARDEFYDRNRLAKETLLELRAQLESNPRQQEVAEPWFVHEPAVLMMLVQEIALAILDAVQQPRQSPAVTTANQGMGSQTRGRRTSVEEEEEAGEGGEEEEEEENDDENEEGQDEEVDDDQDDDDDSGEEDEAEDENQDDDEDSWQDDDEDQDDDDSGEEEDDDDDDND